MGLRETTHDGGTRATEPQTHSNSRASRLLPASCNLPALAQVQPLASHLVKKKKVKQLHVAFSRCHYRGTRLPGSEANFRILESRPRRGLHLSRSLCCKRFRNVQLTSPPVATLFPSLSFLSSPSSQSSHLVAQIRCLGQDQTHSGQVLLSFVL